MYLLRGVRQNIRMDSVTCETPLKLLALVFNDNF